MICGIMVYADYRVNQEIGLSSRVDPARKKPSRRTGKTEAEKTGRKKADCVGAGVCAAYKKKKEKT